MPRGLWSFVGRRRQVQRLNSLKDQIQSDIEHYLSENTIGQPSSQKTLDNYASFIKSFYLREYGVEVNIIGMKFKNDEKGNPTIIEIDRIEIIG